MALQDGYELVERPVRVADGVDYLQLASRPCVVYFRSHQLNNTGVVLFRSSKSQFLLSIILFLLVIGIGLIVHTSFFNNLMKGLFYYVSSLKLKTNFIQDVITVEAVFIGLTIPLSFQVVTSFTKEYGSGVAKIFTDEFWYKAQYVVFLGNIVFGILFRFLEVQSTFWLSIYLVWSIANIIIFLLVINLVNRYVTEPYNVFMKKLRDRVENIF